MEKKWYKPHEAHFKETRAIFLEFRWFWKMFFLKKKTECLDELNTRLIFIQIVPSFDREKSNEIFRLKTAQKSYRKFVVMPIWFDIWKMILI